MVGGLNSTVSRGGRSFSVQTETTGRSGSLVETQVFCDGEMIASRKVSYARLASSAGFGPAELRRRIAIQHTRVVRELREGWLTGDVAPAADDGAREPPPPAADDGAGDEAPAPAPLWMKLAAAAAVLLWVAAVPSLLDGWATPTRGGPPGGAGGTTVAPPPEVGEPPGDTSPPTVRFGPTLPAGSPSPAGAPPVSPAKRSADDRDEPAAAERIRPVAQPSVSRPASERQIAATIPAPPRLPAQPPRVTAPRPDVAITVVPADEPPQAAPPSTEPPAARRRELPRYTRRARRRGDQGLVEMRLLVDVDGSVSRIRLLREIPGSDLNRAAVATVAGWRYAPGRRNGEAVPMWTTEKLQFFLGADRLETVRVITD